MLDTDFIHQVQHPEVERRHWCPLSEKFAGGDVLYRFLLEGWEIADNVAFREKIWYGGARERLIYHLVLQRKGRKIHMAVTENPYVVKMLNMLATEVISVRSHSQRQYEPAR